MVKRPISVTLFGSALMLSLPPATAHAAGPGFCRDYAGAALKQVQIALSTPASRPGLQGTRWSADFRVHYDRCLGASPGDVDSERGAGTGYIRGCRGM